MRTRDKQKKLLHSIYIRDTIHSKTDTGRNAIKMQQAIDDLQKRAADVRAKLKTLQAQSKEAWPNVKNVLEQARLDLETAVDRAVDEYK